MTTSSNQAHATTVSKPLNETHPEAYLSGVLHGDGWCTSLTIGLRVADYEFAVAFAHALRLVFSKDIYPHEDERGYWVTRTSNKTGKYNYLLTFEPTDNSEKAAWVRGLFDSEGNATLRSKGTGENSYGRDIEMFSTNTTTLKQASIYLNHLEIPTYLYPMRSSKSHKGSKVVYRLRVKGGYEYYKKFAELIGSSIPRKQQVLQAIPQSYRPDRSEHCRIAQRKGAAAKHQKLMQETLPAVLIGIRELVEQGIKPTYENCLSIPGYVSIKRYFRQAELVARAIGDIQGNHLSSIIETQQF